MANTTAESNRQPASQPLDAPRGAVEQGEADEKLAQAGYSAEQVDRIHAPIGLDLGAEQPAETAVAIMAEMIRVRHGSGDR